jgi:hypothetical protein
MELTQLTERCWRGGRFAWRFLLRLFLFARLSLQHAPSLDFWAAVKRNIPRAHAQGINN